LQAPGRLLSARRQAAAYFQTSDFRPQTFLTVGADLKIEQRGGSGPEIRNPHSAIRNLVDPDLRQPTFLTGGADLKIEQWGGSSLEIRIPHSEIRNSFCRGC